MWWTWRDPGGVVHATIGDRGQYGATMRQIVCLQSFMDLVFIKSGARQHVTCVMCLGVR